MTRAETEEAEGAAEQAKPPGRVLVVDSKASSAGRSRDILSGAGFDVRLYSSVDELPREAAVDLVFLFDDGAKETAEAVREIRGRLGRHDPQVVLVLPKKKGGRRTEDHGADALLIRPVAPCSLIALARALCRVSSLRRSLRQQEQRLEQALEEAGQIDPRTGFYAFHAFKPLLAAEVKRALRYKYPFSIAIGILDKMRAVREAHGQEQACLLEGGLHLAISRSLRDLDMPVAYGSGQVLLVMPHTPRKGARVTAERVRRRVARTKMGVGDDRIGSTISLGLASYECKGEVSFSGLAQEAAAALKIAVEGGGNRVAEVPITRRRRSPTGV
ncbi:MAG: GGDEF domain-containing protein [Myxococcota bacterium]